MKKKQHKSGSRSMSPAEQLPADIVREIFSYLDLRKLSGIATVSKFWDEQSNHDSRWREYYIREHSELYRLFHNKIPPTLFKKKYLEIKRIIANFQQLRKSIIEKKPWKTKQEISIEIFKKAVKKNSLEIVYILLKEKLLSIHATFSHTGFTSNCTNSTPVHYAAIKGRLDMVKLLLLYGADITKKVTWKYTSTVKNERHGRVIIEKKATYESHYILADVSIFSSSMKSLVCIGYAEHFLFKNDFEAAIRYFKKSGRHDPKIISEYIQQVHQDKRGFKFNYNENLISELSTCFESILNKANEKHCIIS